jgi:hypothetical protein
MKPIDWDLMVVAAIVGGAVVFIFVQLFPGVIR